MHESVGNLKSLWKKYRFEGESPKEGSIAEKRLQETCARYSKLAMYPEKTVRPTPILANHKRAYGGEDYFAELRQQREMADFVWRGEKSKAATPSDRERRELHNQIAVMVMGKTRTGMNDELAHQISNFACELTYGNGKTMEVLEAEKSK